MTNTRPLHDRVFGAPAECWPAHVRYVGDGMWTHHGKPITEQQAEVMFRRSMKNYISAMPLTTEVLATMCFMASEQEHDEL